MHRSGCKNKRGHDAGAENIGPGRVSDRLSADPCAASAALHMAAHCRNALPLGTDDIRTLDTLVCSVRVHRGSPGPLAVVAPVTKKCEGVGGLGFAIRARVMSPTRSGWAFLRLA